MLSVAHSPVRVLFVALLLCAAVFAQSSALESEHRQHRSSQHCCLLCHAGPIPMLQAAIASAAAPVFAAAWLPHSAPCQRKAETSVRPDSCRAPPSTSPVCA